ncbi:ATP-binding protein [Streptomyces sp. NEAU-H22]|uniref:ATP-binding protein n=1 Tax=unclassified Streptomyces TaxID=2593676 RepID=UPI002251C562|nr:MULTISPECIES: ATP-binding protein [unclassified Streptomyces]MCX3285307.1 ATP-binding protein [Streptomyces sp. NEAU-H22]WMD03856.1 ATP-binding protein [Streptomyces sp. FXY-T5]
MLQLSGRHPPDPDARYGPFPQPPLGAGHLSVEYAPRPSAVREARAEVRRQLEGWGLGEDGAVADVAELLVGELATNALVHAGSGFRLTLFAAHGVLRCEVTDAERRVPRVLDAGAGESGRGMFLVDALAQCWGCHRDGPGKTVWFELGTCGSDGCGRRQP